MDLLILGGTRFLGVHLAQIARERGHTVTLFNRGQTPGEGVPDVEQLHGDRDGNLDALQGRKWDVVVDTSGYFPRIVRASARLLADSVERYIFISSCSVYADFSQTGIDESYPVIKLPDESIETLETPDAYGGLKALCEQAVEEELPGRALNIRPGLIVGPYDPTDRFTYWPSRVAKGGEILAPRNPEMPVQFIDVRDLSAWIVRMAETRAAGIYNTIGPDYVLTMGKFLAECRRVTESDVDFVWVNESFLKEHEVEEYSELPLWVSVEMAGFSSFKSDRAREQGLVYRPLAETIRDTLAWAQTRPADHEWRSGLKPTREQTLLIAWHALHSRA
jgi:2'-hydroxyisoflavone reductase